MFSLKYFQQINGRTLWIAGMSPIGPFTTDDPAKALRFPSAQEAMQHPAWLHPTCLTDVVEAPSPLKPHQLPQD